MSSQYKTRAISEKTATPRKEKNAADTRILNVRHLPIRLLAEQVAAFLNCTKDQVRQLTQLGLLHPLGNPINNSTKLYLTAEILALGEDSVACNRITDALYGYNRERNERPANVVDFKKGNNAA